MEIKNIEGLISHGNIEGRKIVLDIVEHAINAVDPYESVRKLVRIENRELRVGHLRFSLSKVGKIYVVGAGKATLRIAEALEDILGDRISKGVINVKRGEKGRLKKIMKIEAGHPIPDEASLEGAKEIMDIARNAEEGDLVFCIFTGGSSALMVLPAEGISLEDKKIVNDLLLKSGMRTRDINAVRKHISAIKGGRLAKYIHPAEIINLTIGNIYTDLPAELWYGPSWPDTTTFEDAVTVLKRYNLWEKVPKSVRSHLEKADPKFETLKEEDFREMKVHTFLLPGNKEICEAAAKRVEELGIKPVILSTMIEGEARHVGTVLACIGKEIERFGRPFKPPCVLISSGEMTVTVQGDGEGGRNQEFALISALVIDGSESITVASVDTDGTDGPTNIAGGIVDSYTLKRANEKGIDIFENLKKNNSSPVLRELEDAIMTGPTGVNVMNFRVTFIASEGAAKIAPAWSIRWKM